MKRVREPATRAPWRRHWARLLSWLFRFRTLPRAERLFAGVPPGTWLSRPYLGLRLWVDVGRSSTERLLYLEGTRMSPEQGLLLSLLSPGMRVADVGANIGYYTLAFAAAVGPSGSVDSIEPMPENQQTLARNVEANGLAQVRIHRCAVGAGHRVVRLQPGFNAVVAASGTLEVPMRPLDDLFPEGVDLVKIDIEGYEGQALAGARELLSRWQPVLFIELHPGLVKPPDHIAAILAELAELYPEVELWKPRQCSSWPSKIGARYGRQGVQRIGPGEPWRAVVEAAGRERAPFWALCRPAQPPQRGSQRAGAAPLGSVSRAERPPEGEASS